MSGHENVDDVKRKDSFEGEYDHSKEYDPFQVIFSNIFTASQADAAHHLLNVKIPD